MPEPYVRKFDLSGAPKPRLTLTYTTWRGISIGATHFYLTARWEGNPLWDPDPEGDHWTTCWDDPVAKDKERRFHCLTPAGRARTARRLAKLFPDHVVEHVRSDQDVVRNWRRIERMRRDGD